MKKFISVTMCMMIITSVFSAISAMTVTAETEQPSLTADPTMVADIQMEDGAGQYATDSTPYGNNAILADLASPQDADPEWSVGAFGGCLDFNGTTDIITIPDTASMHLAAQTIEFWAEVPVGGDDCTLFIEQFNSNTSNNEVCRMFSDGRIQYIFNGGWWDVDTGVGGVTLGGWQHFALTRSGSPSGTARIYVNGTEIANDVYSGFEFDSTKALFIGGRNTLNNAGDHFDGKMDKVRVWSRELSASEIMNSYTGIYPPFRINGNADFAAHATSGSGIVSDPWIFENLEINGTGLGYGIYIGNTTQYFVIRNCTLGNATGGADDIFYPDAGLVLYDTSRGTIENCTFRDNGVAGALLYNNVRQNSFINSTFLDNGEFGVDTWDTRATEFNNVTVSGNVLAGVRIRESSGDIDILDSDIVQNGDGVRIVEFCNSTTSIYMCNVSDNTGNGVLISDSNNTLIQNNSLTNNGCGVRINSGIGNLVYNNRFIGNTLHAEETGTGNLWNATYPTGGNYWEDYSGQDSLSGPLQDQPGSDSIGDTPYGIDADSIDHYPLWFPAEIDYIRIVDGANGTGNPAGANEYAYPGFNITLWAAGYNNTYGYIGDISANWTNVNYSGAQSEITNATGYSTTWQAGPTEGTALLTAEFNSMTCEVNVTISTYVADLRIDGKTDNVYEDTPVTQISWKNITQGGSAVYTVVAQNDGLTPGPFELVWDISGLPGSFYPVIFNTDAGTNVTSAINAGNLTFNLNPGATVNFLLRINATATAGFGQSAMVNISILSPSGEPDNGTAIVGVLEPDYIEITETPGGAALTNVNLLLSQQLTVYASAYNATGPTYLGLVPVNWTDVPELGNFDDNTSTSVSTFTATATGTTAITGEGFGLTDTFNVIISALDTVSPISSVNNITEYWQNSAPTVLEATAADDSSIVANVTLWFRYSEDNHSWESWTAFSADAVSPWNWDFAFTNGSGYYEFYSIAADTAGNTEPAPADADTSCAYDTVKPTIEDISATSSETGDIFTVTATILDEVLRLHGAHLIYWFGTGAEVNVTFDGSGLRTYNITIPADSLDTLHYRIAAVDWAGNWNTTSVKDVTITDDSAPEADAGGDMDAETGDEIIFDGSASSDNIDIENYTWEFTYNGTTVYLYGQSPAFTFWTAGNYSVTLTVSDAEGLESTDTFTVSVKLAVPVDDDDDDDDAEGSIGDYWWIIIIIIVVMLILLLILLKKRKKDDEEPQDEKISAGESGNSSDSDSGTASAPPGSI